MSADQPPLSLVELSPPGLRQLLDDAGIKWRIIVVSACYSGGFIEPLQDEYTLIVTAARADRKSFGCGNDSDSTFFGEAFFQKGMATADSLAAAFDAAKVRVGEREQAGGFSPPSEPQWWVGSAMEAEAFRPAQARRQRRRHDALQCAAPRRIGGNSPYVSARLTQPPRALTMEHRSSSTCQ